jgi:phage tail tape-measure protein
MLLDDSDEIEGGNFFKDIAKTASKTAKSVAKESKKVAKKVDKYATPVLKKGTTLGLDIVEKAAPALGGIAGAAAATALGQPELIPVFGAMGSATGDQLAKRGRKEVKKQTCLGNPRISPWIEHVKRYANDK